MGNTYAGNDFNYRQLVRSFFAFVEGTIFLFKISAYDDYMNKNKKTLYTEEDFVFENKYESTNSGQIIKKSAIIPFLNNVKFAFDFYCKVHKSKKKVYS